MKPPNKGLGMAGDGWGGKPYGQELRRATVERDSQGRMMPSLAILRPVSSNRDSCTCAAFLPQPAKGECPCNEADEDVEEDVRQAEQDFRRFLIIHSLFFSSASHHVVELILFLQEPEVLEHGSVMNLRLCPATKLREPRGLFLAESSGSSEGLLFQRTLLLMRALHWMMTCKHSRPFASCGRLGLDLAS